MRSREGALAALYAACIVAAVTFAACNAPELTRGASTPAWSGSPTPNASGWTTPTPPPVAVQVGPDDCFGNADAQQKFPGDIDDGGGTDAYLCLWLCAVDATVDPSPPHELLEVWDFDPPNAPTQYRWNPQVPGYPQVLPCNSWHP